MQSSKKCGVSPLLPYHPPLQGRCFPSEVSLQQLVSCLPLVLLLALCWFCGTLKKEKEQYCFNFIVQNITKQRLRTRANNPKTAILVTYQFKKTQLLLSTCMFHPSSPFSQFFPPPFTLTLPFVLFPRIAQEKFAHLF